MYKVIGIDEAGKGPVLGSMIIAFSIIILDDPNEFDSYQKNLKELGVRDSKLLAPKKRREIYHKLKDMMDIKFLQLTPALIDHNNEKGGKLNELEVSAIANMLEHEKPNKIYIDSLTALPDKFGKDILSRLSFDCEIVSENRADSKYEIVGAASIVAKELREEETSQAKEELGIDFGSGYPSDPKTKKFIKENYMNPKYEFMIRKSWQTYKNLIKKEIQKGLDEF